MRDFRRAVTRLLLATCFLLFIAWVALKLIAYRGDWERLLRDGQDWASDWSQRLQPVWDFLLERVEWAAQKLREMVPGL